MKLGIFGGTFNPTHVAHLILAAEAHHQLALDRVLWVLTPDPPHKEGKLITPLEKRFEMLISAIASNPGFEISPAEIERPAPHYAVDTMKILAKRYPGDDLVYLMGGDSLKDLPTWARPLEFISTCAALGVMRRPGDEVNLKDLELLLPGISAKVSHVSAPLLGISATQIRQRIAVGLPFRYFLPEPVYRFIEENGLYR